MMMFLEKDQGVFLETSMRFYKFTGAPIITSNSRPKSSGFMNGLSAISFDHISMVLSMPMMRTSCSMLASFKYRFGIKKRPLLSSVMISTSETNWRKIIWCFGFQLFRRLRNSFICAFHALSGYNTRQS